MNTTEMMRIQQRELDAQAPRIAMRHQVQYHDLCALYGGLRDILAARDDAYEADLAVAEVRAALDAVAEKFSRYADFPEIRLGHRTVRYDPLDVKALIRRNKDKGTAAVRGASPVARVTTKEER